jgi:hypothetical protein
MTEPKEICTVFLGRSMLDDDYTLYEDRRVKRFYDRNMYSLNNEEWLDAKNLRIHIKQELLDKCSEELKEKARQLLDL